MNNNNIVTISELFDKGIIIIKNIFTISLLYLDNISDIYNISEKGYVYFIEFINQMYISNCQENSFNLTTKDAIIFAYKRTIFGLDNKISNISNNLVCLENTSKTNNSNSLVYELIYKYINIINNLLIFNKNINFYENKNLENNSISKLIKKLLNNLHSNNNDFATIDDLLNNINNYINKLIMEKNYSINFEAISKYITKKNYIECKF